MEKQERLARALADRYRIEREIGRGGMATVNLAQDLKYHRRVALKVLDPDLTQDVAGKRFLRETEIVPNPLSGDPGPIHAARCPLRGLVSGRR